MGRPRQFDTAAVVAAARDAFVRGGYLGTSIDDLLRATGLQRASLYSAFGSKRGLFLAALQRSTGDPNGAVDLDLVIVALMDLAGEDAEIRDEAGRMLEHLDGPAERMGERLLRRAGLASVTEERKHR